MNIAIQVSRLVAIACVLALTSAPARSQSDWPTKPIKLLVPFAVGGGIDLMARITAQRLSEQLGQQVVVENQGGGGGTIASAAVARAAPDGYTLVFHSVSSAVVNAVTLPKLSYDPIGGFTPVTLAARFPLVMVINPEIPARTMREFIALLKASPGKYSYGSSGIGTGIHIAAELFKSLAQVDIVHVPYKGTAAVMSDLLAGRVAMLLDGVPPQVSNINGGKVRALAVTTTTRSEVLPSVPTMVESGLAGYDIPFWTAIFAPAGTPKTSVDRIAAEVGKGMKNPETMKRLKELGAEGVGSTPEELERFWRAQLVLYAKIVKDANIRVEQQ